jgi:anti-repressor protein
MNEIIKIQTNDNLDQVVSARELHEKLGIQKKFTDWIYAQIERLNLMEGVDFFPFWGESTGGRPSTDYLVVIDIAKHIAMISGGEKAHEIRNYFIQVERAWNSPDQVMNRALEFSRRALAKAQEQLHIMEPKALFADAVATSRNSILIGELAKLLNQNGINVGQNRLFSYLREKDYLCTRGESRNLPTQRAMDMNLFEIKKRTIMNADGSNRTTSTTKVTGKGQIYFINHFKKELVQVSE